MKKTLRLLAVFFVLSAKGQEPPFPQRSPIEINRFPPSRNTVCGVLEPQ